MAKAMYHVLGFLTPFITSRGPSWGFQTQSLNHFIQGPKTLVTTPLIEKNSMDIAIVETEPLGNPAKQSCWKLFFQNRLKPILSLRLFSGTIFNKSKSWWSHPRAFRSINIIIFLLKRKRLPRGFQGDGNERRNGWNFQVVNGLFIIPLLLASKSPKSCEITNLLVTNFQPDALVKNSFFLVWQVQCSFSFNVFFFGFSFWKSTVMVCYWFMSSNTSPKKTGEWSSSISNPYRWWKNKHLPTPPTDHQFEPLKP